MRDWRDSTAAIAGAVLFAVGYSATVWAAPCDEYDPASRARSARIVLNGADFLDEQRDELRSFVETGSLGMVNAELVSVRPKAPVRSFFAGPKISRFSPYYGEELKGVAVGLTLEPTKRPITVVIRLRQVCAKYFRNSFLFY